MKIKPRTILLITISFLFLLMVLWIDDLYLKTSSFLNYKYEFIKILIHSLIAYKLSKFITSKFNLENKYSISFNSIFTILFLLFNSYILFQYISRTISHRIIYSKSRAELAEKTIKLQHSGNGFECDSMTYKQFKEITKYTNLPDIPNEAKDIYIHDWSEFDFSRIIKFSLRKDYPIQEFYKTQPDFEKNVDILEIEFDAIPHKQINYNNSNYYRYKWEVGES